MKKDECITLQKEHAVKLREKKQTKEKKEIDKIEKVRKGNIRAELDKSKNKKKLTDSCQKLARMVDALFGNINCIDCGKPLNEIIDGGHFHSKGNNDTLRYNLHNIHSQRRSCNGFEGGKHLGYYRGLICRYGQEYADYVDAGMQQQYKYLGLTGKDIVEKLRIVNSLIRNFDTFQFLDSIDAREKLNIMLGIYGKSVYLSCETNKIHQ